MLPQKRLRLVAVFGVVLVLMVLLAAALPSLTLLPEREMELPSDSEVVGTVLDLGWLIGLLIAMYAIAMIWLMPSSLRRRLAYMLLVVGGIAGLIVGLVVLLDDTVIPPLPTSLQSSRATPTHDPFVEQPLVETVIPLEVPEFVPPPRWIGTLLTLCVGTLLVVLVLVIAWHLRAHYREATLPPLAQLADEARVALNALRDGGNVRDVVLRCYFEMARVLDEAQGIRRVETVTPREFAVQLTALGLPAVPVQTLTALFEEARYGMRVADAAAADHAIASLTAIVAACEALT